MLAGKFPSQKLIQTYDLLEYSQIVEACMNGEMCMFETAMELEMDSLIYSAVFTTVE